MDNEVINLVHCERIIAQLTYPSYKISQEDYEILQKKIGDNLIDRYVRIDGGAPVKINNYGHSLDLYYIVTE